MNFVCSRQMVNSKRRGLTAPQSFHVQRPVLSPSLPSPFSLCLCGAIFLCQRALCLSSISLAPSSLCSTARWCSAAAAAAAALRACVRACVNPAYKGVALWLGVNMYARACATRSGYTRTHRDTHEGPLLFLRFVAAASLYAINKLRRCNPGSNVAFCLKRIV